MPEGLSGFTDFFDTSTAVFPVPAHKEAHMYVCVCVYMGVYMGVSENKAYSIL